MSRVGTRLIGASLITSLDFVEPILELILDGFDLGHGFVEEAIDFMLHTDVEFIVVFVELDGLDSLVHLLDEKAESLFSGKLIVGVRRRFGGLLR
jgi:hypothetical protein